MAPSKEIRELQKSADSKNNVLKSKRKELGQVFVQEYNKRVINTFDFTFFLKNLQNIGAKNIVLFCVEENHKACHRSIVASRLINEYLYNVIHL